MKRYILHLVMMVFAAVFPISFHCVWAEYKSNQFSSDIQSRLDEIEKRQLEIMVKSAETESLVKSFLDDRLTIGGFFEPAITSLAGSNTKTQITESQNTLGLNIAASFSERTKFVSQFLTGLSISLNNQHNDPRAVQLGQSMTREFGTIAFGAIVSQGYLEYFWSDAFRIQGGMGYVPFGIALQKRELVLFERRGGPQVLRTQDLVSPLWSGIQGFGSFQIGAWRTGYHLYSFTSLTQPQIPGAGTRIWGSSPYERMTIGFSTQVGKRDSDTYKAIGTDLALRLGALSIDFEWIQNVSEGDDPWAIYLRPAVSVFDDRVLLYIFGDYAESPLNKTGSGRTALSDPYKKWEYGGGVNWLPTSYTRLRLGLTLNQYVGATASPSGQSRDFIMVDTSAGIAF